jgi:hypothetical protein
MSILQKEIQLPGLFHCVTSRKHITTSSVERDSYYLEIGKLGTIQILCDGNEVKQQPTCICSTIMFECNIKCALL